jgi:hypothetical protein
MSNTIKNTVTLNGKRYVCKIYFLSGYDDGYTIVFKGYRPQNRELIHPYIGCSEHGSYYHGELDNYDPKDAQHIGKRVAFNDLPEAVQKVIILELTTK